MTEVAAFRPASLAGFFELLAQDPDAAHDHVLAAVRTILSDGHVRGAVTEYNRGRNDRQRRRNAISNRIANGNRLQRWRREPLQVLLDSAVSQQ
jgi:hypothetical protein